MSDSHVVITGTGRAGTTFLIQLLTKLGQDTGFEPETLEVLPIYLDALRGERSYYENIRAGMELNINIRSIPRIVKTPNMDLKRILGTSVQIEHALIPVREFTAAAQSRLNNQLLQTGCTDGDPKVPGGLWGTDLADDQLNVLRIRFSEIIETCVLNDVPMTFLSFPRFLLDPAYLFSRISFLLKGINYEDYVPVFHQTVRIDWVRGAVDGQSAREGYP